MNYAAALATLAIGCGTFWKLLKYFYPCITYDYQFLKCSIGNLRRADKLEKKTPEFTVVDLLIDRCKTDGDKNFIKYQDETWTFNDVNNMSNKIARALNGRGVKYNDMVGIMMSSQPYFVTSVFGIAKTGATASLINCNLQKHSLMHSIRISKFKRLIISSDEFIVTAIEEIHDELKSENIEVFILGKSEKEISTQLISLSALIESESNEETPFAWREEVKVSSNFCLIFSSGTTGLPKAVNMTHKRCHLLSVVPSYYGIGKNDVIYCALPLYHTNGFALGVVGSIYMGSTVALRKKFSASNFMADCRKYKATVVQYIGEVISYICMQPENDNDKDNCIKYALGNGMRLPVWKEFLRRFGPDIKVAEYYGASEGLVGFINLDFHLGSIGRISGLMRKILKIAFVKYDFDKNEIARDENGRAIQTGRGEAGLLLCNLSGKISAKYDGYYGAKKESEAKIIHNVVVEGDKYFNTGDIIMWDNDYYVSFSDRVGDTFRWKGENVSTNEVANIIKLAKGIDQPNVYGVQVPGQSGRCGMAAITLKEDDFDFAQLVKILEANLPSYAHPRFIRLVEKQSLTGTMKFKKNHLVTEGYDLDKVKEDKLYFLHPQQKAFVKLTKELVEEIENKTIKF